MVHVGAKTTTEKSRIAHRVYVADARSLHEVHDKSVHLVVTSPPYWQLKNYDSPGQIGFHDTYEEYINNLNLVCCKFDQHPDLRRRQALVPGNASRAAGLAQCSRA